MQKRETFTTFETKGRKFKIDKFDAYTGSYIAYTLLTEALPMGIGNKLGIPISGAQKKMSKDDFIALQKDCLKHVSEKLQAGDTPIIDDNGNWSVADLEKNSSLVLALTVKVLMYNVESFFDADLLDSINPGEILTSFQQN